MDLSIALVLVKQLARWSAFISEDRLDLYHHRIPHSHSCLEAKAGLIATVTAELVEIERKAQLDIINH